MNLSVAGSIVFTKPSLARLARAAHLLGLIACSSLTGCGSDGDPNAPYPSGGAAGTTTEDAQVTFDVSTSDVSSSGGSATGGSGPTGGGGTGGSAGRVDAGSGAGAGGTGGATVSGGAAGVAIDSGRPADAAAPEASRAACGNGVVEGNEACDDGTTIDKCTQTADGGRTCDDKCSPICTDNTACNTCLQEQCPDYMNLCEDVGDQTPSGRVKVAHCNTVYECVSRTHCAIATATTTTAIPCYCGTASSETGGDCYTPGKANGACKREIEDGFDTEDPLTILNNYTDFTQPAGAVMNKVYCEIAVCADSCYYGRLVPAKPSGMVDGGPPDVSAEAAAPEAAAPSGADGSVIRDAAPADARAAGDAATVVRSALPVNAACVACEKSTCSYPDNDSYVCREGSAATQATCFELLDCIRTSGCFGASGFYSCYCGTVNTAACSAAQSVADGTCKTQIERVVNSTEQDSVYRSLIGSDSRLARISEIMACDYNAPPRGCSSQCVPYVR